MRFILKAVFWFAVVIMLLPARSPNITGDNVDRSVTTGTVSSAREIRNLANRLQSVCEQNPDLCVSSLNNMSMVAAMLGYHAGALGSCSDDES